jgi:hypothetical protein
VFFKHWINHWHYLFFGTNQQQPLIIDHWK